jgi:hypothetical protein
MLVAQAALYAPESSATVTVVPALKLGGSFTAARHEQVIIVTSLDAPCYAPRMQTPSDVGFA